MELKELKSAELYFNLQQLQGVGNCLYHSLMNNYPESDKSDAI